MLSKMDLRDWLDRVDFCTDGYWIIDNGSAYYFESGVISHNVRSENLSLSLLWLASCT